MHPKHIARLAGLALLALLLPALARAAQPAAQPPVPRQITQTTVFYDPSPLQTWRPYSERVALPSPVTLVAGPFERMADTTTTDYVELDVLMVIYPNTAAGYLSPEKVERVRQQSLETAVFLWRNSHLKLHINYTFEIINDYKDASEFEGFSSTCGWLMPEDRDGDGESVENDLIARGYNAGQYDSINLLWAHNFGTIAPCSGGYAFGIYAWPQLGPSSLTTNILFEWGNDIWNPFHHEFQHAIDALFESAGNPDYFHADYPWKEAERFGDDRDFHATMMRAWPTEDWFDLLPAWGDYGTTPDADGDSVPDLAPQLYLTEATLGSAPTAADTDADDLDDLGESMAGHFHAADPVDMDTDGDGLRDGRDIAPLYVIDPHIPRASPLIDGCREDWSLYTQQVFESNAPLDAALYLNWDEDMLYLMVEMDRYALVDVYLDGNGDGWWHGRDNYFFTLHPDVPGPHSDDLFANFYIWDCSPTVTGQFGYCMDDRASQHPAGHLVEITEFTHYARTWLTGYRVQVGIPANLVTQFQPGPGQETGVQVTFHNVDRSGSNWARFFEYQAFTYPLFYDPMSFEPNDTPANATPLEIGAEVATAVAPAGDVDVYRVETLALDRLVFDIDADDIGSPLDATLTLLDTDGTTPLAVSTDDGRTNDPRLIHVIPRDGTYYLTVVDGRDPPDGGDDHFYHLNLTLTEVDEPNDSFAQATPLAYGDSHAARISPEYDTDCYVFSGQWGDEITADIDAYVLGSPLHADLYLYDASGNSLDLSEEDGQSPDPLLHYTLPWDGTYYLRVGAPAGGRHYTYTLHLNRKPRAAIGVSPPVLAQALFAGQTATQMLTLTNPAEGDLLYNIYTFTADPQPMVPPTLLADDNGYTVVDSLVSPELSYSWIEIAPEAGGTGLPLSELEGSPNHYYWPVDLPFDFMFYGQTYDQVAVGTSGLIYFEDRRLTGNNQPIPGLDVPLIASFWEDLIVWEYSGVYVQDLGRALVVEYYEVAPFYAGTGGTWQAILFDNGNILFQYQDLDFELNAVNFGGSATVGIQADGQTGLQYSYNSPVLQDGQALCFVAPGNTVAQCEFNNVAWLTVTPQSGTVAPDDSAELEVAFDAANLAPGLHAADIVVASNAVNEPAVTVRAGLLVSVPILSVTPQEAAADGYVGSEARYMLQVTNTSDAAARFIVTHTSGTWPVAWAPRPLPWLNPGETLDLEVLVSVPRSTADGTVEVSELAFRTHDPTVQATAVLTTTARHHHVHAPVVARP